MGQPEMTALHTATRTTPHTATTGYFHMYQAIFEHYSGQPALLNRHYRGNLHSKQQSQPQHLLHGAVAGDDESAAFDYNLLHFHWIRVRVQCLTLDDSDAQGDGGVFGQGRRNVQVVVEGVAGRPIVVEQITEGEQVSWERHAE